MNRGGYYLVYLETALVLFLRGPFITSGKISFLPRYVLQQPSGAMFLARER